MPISRIDDLFQSARRDQRTMLVAYLTVGDPSLDDSYACAVAALEGGADLLELGVPFSDPTADGPTIAAASHRALKNGGSVKGTLEVAKRLRAVTDKPLVLFSYCNPLFAFGDEALPRAAAAAGIDGLLVVDLPPEEGESLRAHAKQQQLAFIPLLAPTSDAAREQRAFETASGFIYYVSMTGVTGSRSVNAEEAGSEARALRQRAGIPLVVGFGVDSPEKARQIAEFGVEGVAVGSQIVRTIARHTSTEERVNAVRTFVASLRTALDEPKRQANPSS